MYAIVEIAGQQFKVAKDQQLFVHRLAQKEGEKVAFENVLLIDNKGKVNVGTPVIKGASVSVKILEHLKGDKVIVFKKKRRKGYKVKNGHRQYLTKVQVEAINEKGVTPKKVEAKTEEKPKTSTATQTATKTTAKPKAEVKSATKKVAPKTVTKKVTSKKEDKTK